MLETDAWEQEADRYRRLRVEEARRIPGLDWSAGLAFLHVLPLGRLRERAELGGRVEYLAAEFGEGAARNAKFNFDGLRLANPAGGQGRLLVQFLRNGGSEVCWSLARLGFKDDTGTHRYLSGELTNKEISLMMSATIKWLDHIGVKPPHLACLTLMNVEDLFVVRSQRGFFYDMDGRAFDRSPVVLPGILVDSHEDERVATDEILELMWQSAQWPGNPLPITRKSE